MSEVLFYHLTQTPLEKTLPELLEKSLERGWQVFVRTTTDERMKFLDDILWSYHDDRFLPHSIDGAGDETLQPILISKSEEVSNAADILMLVDGAGFEIDDVEKFKRICLLFDGNDAVATDAARADWKRISEANIPAKYWAQDSGRWVQKAESKPSD